MLKAVIYDFDGTLTPESTAQFQILEKSGFKNGMDDPRFFVAVKTMMKEKKIGLYEATIWVLLDTVRSAGYHLTDKNIGLGADERVYNSGVEELLIYLKDHNIQNYLLSSGAQAYLKQLKIAPYFEGIYASVLSYDDNGEADGIERVMSEEEKVVALQEIAERVNDTPDNFSGIVYIGDGPTDFAALEYIKQRGGIAVLVNNKDIDTKLTGIVNLVTTTDFTQDGELMQYLKRLIET